jgi:hypothetical protein
MRTTLELADDVLLAVKDRAARAQRTVGQEVSDLVRKALQADQRHPAKRRNGVPLFPVKPGGAMVTMELVNRLRDEAP